MSKCLVIYNDVQMSKQKLLYLIDEKVKYAQTCFVTSPAVCSNLHQTESLRICMYLNNDPCVIM